LGFVVRPGTEKDITACVDLAVLIGAGDAAAWSDTPAGWYLLGVVVHPKWRRRGIGAALTRERMRWVAQRATEIYYFTHRNNRASQALHERFGFVNVLGDWIPPGGIPAGTTDQRLYAADLRDL
jgi:ribosomal protein S18 acetylase RimI-like enzyme